MNNGKWYTANNKGEVGCHDCSYSTALNNLEVMLKDKPGEGWQMFREGSDDYITSLDDYRDSLPEGLNDEEEVDKEIETMEAAKVGTVKANCWEKLSEDLFLIYNF